jgi:hypothetical protein
MKLIKLTTTITYMFMQDRRMVRTIKMFILNLLFMNETLIGYILVDKNASILGTSI